MGPLNTFVARFGAALNSAMAGWYGTQDSPMWLMVGLHIYCALLCLRVLWKTRKGAK